MKAPSKRELMRLPGMTTEAAHQIRDCFHREMPMQALDAADRIISGHGREYIEFTKPDNIRYRGDLWYVNMGDTYRLTLCYNSHTRHAWVGTWGDFVEKNEKRYGIK